MTTTAGIYVGNIVQVEERLVFHGKLRWEDGIIRSIETLGPERCDEPYLIPGFIDAHVHVESSMLPPAEFARQAVRHGTIGAVCDPHEIANVLGIEGVRFMLENARRTPFKFAFGIPSCVPATPFETAGATLDLAEIETLFKEPEVTHLAEMMNFPGVLSGDEAVLAKIAIARRLGRPVDGHAPGLRGEAASRYAASGISTDHECTSLEEAEDKLAAGMHILIREGSAARNFDTLQPLIASHPRQVMLCSDDKHPDDLIDGHIDRLAARAVAAGHDPLAVLQVACANPVHHYGLPVGLLRPGEAMDAVEVRDLRDFRPLRTWVGGQQVAQDGETLLAPMPTVPVNRFAASAITSEALALPYAGGRIRVIEARDGELLTREILETPKVENGQLLADPAHDLLLLVVLNRYAEAPPAVAFVRGFGLKAGAIASSVAHDSHNLVAVGADAASICTAINALIAHRGGVAVAHASGVECLPLPIAGLMSDDTGEVVAERYAALDRAAKALGSSLRTPFMSLSFMALLVIPELKLSDKGLFDGRSFRFTELAA